MKRKLVAAMAAAGLLAAVTAPGAAAIPPLHKCNAGGGNGSEGGIFHDCDPGNSGANNQAGD